MTVPAGPVDPVASLDAQLALMVAGVAAGTAAPRLWHRRQGDGYQQERGCTGTLVAIDDGAELRFALPAGPVDFVQLRVPALSGRYRIDRVAVDGQPIDGLARRVVLVLHEATTTYSDGALCIASAEGAPVFELDMRGLLNAAPRASNLDLRIRREDGAAASLEAGAASSTGHMADALTLLRALGDEAFVQAALQRRAHADARADRERTDALLSRTVDMLHGLSMEVATQREELVQLEARLGGQLGARHDGQGMRLDEAIDLLHAAAQREEDQRQALDALRSELAALRHGIDHVFWKRWARRLSGRPQ